MTCALWPMSYERGGCSRTEGRGPGYSTGFPSALEPYAVDGCSAVGDSGWGRGGYGEEREGSHR